MTLFLKKLPRNRKTQITRLFSTFKKLSEFLPLSKFPKSFATVMSYQLWKDSLTEQAEIVIKEKWPTMANKIHDSIDNKKLDSSRVPEVRRAGIRLKLTNGHGEKVTVCSQFVPDYLNLVNLRPFQNNFRPKNDIFIFVYSKKTSENVQR